MIIVILGLIVFGIAVGYGFVKLVNAIFNPMIKKLEDKNKRVLKTENPYVQAHRRRRNNDDSYEEYLEWLNKTGGDLPIDKLKTEEELRFEDQMNG